MRKRIAQFISTIGHPLISIPTFVLIVMFSFEKTEKASFVSFLIIGGVIFPMVIWMLIQTRQGKYSNFDVSVRNERKSLFVFTLPLLAIVTIILFATHQSKSLCLSVFFAFLLALVSHLVNFYIKSSLHVSLTIYLAAMVFPLNNILGIILFLFSILIGWSRIELKRHTRIEVVVGGIIGAVISISMLLSVGFFTF